MSRTHGEGGRAAASSRRLRTLLHTASIHAPEDDKGRWDGDWSRYDLRRLRSQPARDNLRPLLTAFEKAYLAASGGEDGIAIPLKRVYELLVLRPGQGREYTEVDFLLDVYRLDRAGAQVTPAGRELTLPASTGTRAGKGLRFVTETGEERWYSSIRFDAIGT